uniref:Uncharacterized protein n=1 Tax=Meloidogyne enterolobii TaxID=390850 RepID=A0A6V7XMK9_MELEN|nr:unnamed protein product [Meloidogyne enterolobii]
MAEEGPSNFDLESKLNKQINGLIKLSNDFNNLQIKLNEEKEKSVNLEKKNQSLEIELKEIKKTDDLYNKRLSNLSVKLDNLIFEYVNFVKIENKWNEINSGYKCCDNNLYTNKPTGNY